MRNSRLPVYLVLLLAFGVVLPAAAQTASAESGSAPRRITDTDRLFLSFAEEATLVDRQWWEGQAELQDATGYDVRILRGIAAFQPWAQVEFGGSVGFGDSDVPGPFSDGSGATDLDLWAKYHFGRSGATEYAAGGRATIPTGDDSVGLGYDAFSFGAFGSLRHRGERLTFTGNLGINLNGDGRFFGFPTDGDTSLTGGIGVLVPAGDKLTFVGEGRFESERFEGGESNSRVLGGINLKVGEGRVFRAALALGLSDGAPDGQLIVAYAATF